MAALVAQFVVGYVMVAEGDFEKADCDPPAESQDGGDLSDAAKARIDRIEKLCERRQDRLDARADDPLGTAYSDLASGDIFRGGLSLPEIHVWLGCPDTGEIIDFTTGLWPAACRATLGMGWLAALPPPYFWNFGPRRPPGVNYQPARDAIDCVVELLRLQGREYP